jgi:hypothetical protein
VAELRHALAVEPGDDDLDEDGLYETEVMVSVCAGLVTVDEESSQIRLVHYTTQDYFEHIRIAQFPEAPSIIAQTCLTYLMFSPFAEKCCPSIEELTSCLNKYPFLRYAANYWVEHIRDGTDDYVRELALEYLSNKISIISARQAVGRERFDFEFRWYWYGGWTPILTRLHVVVSFGLVDIARKLLADGADVNVRAHRGLTPLHIATEAGRTQMVQLLLRAGAEVDVEDIDRQTPLHKAARAGHKLMCKYL